MERKDFGKEDLNQKLKTAGTRTMTKQTMNRKAEDTAIPTVMPKQTIHTSKTKKVEPQTNASSQTGSTIKYQAKESKNFKL